MNTLIKKSLNESIEVKRNILNDEILCKKIENISLKIIDVYKNGGKVILCGNGGSASDAIHISAELLGRFKKERLSLPAIALNADVATITAISNDYGYENVFCRQVEGYMNKNDILIGISTSGNSENIYKALLKAKLIGGYTFALLGGDGGKILNVADASIVVPSKVTARIQESHITIAHIICEIIDNYFDYVNNYEK